MPAQQARVDGGEPNGPNGLGTRPDPLEFIDPARNATHYGSMSDIREFRVLKRSTAMLLVGSVLAAAAVLVWACMLWIDSYGDRMVILNAMSPEQAAAELASDLRMFAVVLFALMLALSGFLVWYGLRILRSRSLPPAGAWIIEGQHIRSGREAATAAWVLLVFAGLVALFAFVTAALVWSLAATA